LGHHRRLTPPQIGEMGVPNTGITPGNRKHAVEFGLPVANQNHPNSSIILRKHEKNPKHFAPRAVEPKTELRWLALERACRDAI
jgi:hypothetical protein